MIQTSSLKSLIRYKLKDNNEVSFSDYDILQAINEVLRYVNQYYINTDFMERLYRFDEDEYNKNIDKENEALDESDENEDAVKQEHIDFCKDGVPFPDDFLSMQRIVDAKNGAELTPCETIRPPRHGEYKVLGNKIYLGTKCADMIYNAVFVAIDNIDTGEIDLPNIFMDVLTKLACMILQNNPDTDVMREAAESALQAVIPLRRYVHVEKRMPFIC